MFRIGHGYDTHCFEEGCPLVLGGVLIPYNRGLKAHSDGDVVLHAICDALLGAAALGDIGQHFSDTDLQYANSDSREFLRKVVQKIKDKQYDINNVDVTLLAQAPKIAPYMTQMRTLIASDLEVSFDQVNIKATTTEQMGFVGRGEGIACYAVALINNAQNE
jgi:2-C-methyl-D-erythritol 2,4-cyclodiphosphate synthase